MFTFAVLCGRHKNVIVMFLKLVLEILLTCKMSFIEKSIFQTLHQCRIFILIALCHGYIFHCCTSDSKAFFAPPYFWEFLLIFIHKLLHKCLSEFFNCLCELPVSTLLVKGSRFFFFFFVLLLERLPHILLQRIWVLLYYIVTSVLWINSFQTYFTWSAVCTVIMI